MADYEQRQSETQVVDGVIVGNFYNKYDTRNPIARHLVNRFLDTVAELYRRTSASSVLEVGCGEGRLAEHLFQSAPPPDRFEACDLTLQQVPSHIKRAIRFREASIYDLPYGNREFDLVVCCQVLEHVVHPGRGLKELARVARSAVLLSAPREPIWRLMNMARGCYLASLGNTPGHLQHFSRRSLMNLSCTRLDVTECRCPLPWVVLLGTPKRKIRWSR